MSAAQLSDAAKIMAAVWWGINRKTALTFHLRESRPTPHTQAALDELVSAGVISSEPFNRYGGITYRALQDCRPFYAWFLENQEHPEAKLPLTEPISRRRK
jgi:hypothetical protein